MGIFRKSASILTVGGVNYRGKNERATKYAKQTRNAARAQVAQNAAMLELQRQQLAALDHANVREEVRDLRPVAPIAPLQPTPAAVAPALPARALPPAAAPRYPAATVRPAVAVAQPPRSAPKGRKQLHRAFTMAQAHGPSSVWMPLIDQAATQPAQAIAARTVGGVLGVAKSPDWALGHLSAVLATPGAPDGDPETAAYAAALEVSTTVAGLPMTLPLGRLLVGLLVGTLHDERVELAEAQAAVAAMPDSAVARLAQADLAVRCGNPEVAISRTDGISNTDDVTAMALAVRAAALRAVGQDAAAVVVAEAAFQDLTRSSLARHRARFEAGSAHAHLGSVADARTQFETILAEDSSYPGARDALTGLPA